MQIKTMNHENFNPSSPEYKEVKDLPKEEQVNFADVEGGFVRSSAMKELEEAKPRAELAEKSRTLLEKALGRHYKTHDILHHDGVIENNKIDAENRTEKMENERIVVASRIDHLMGEARRLDVMGEDEKKVLIEKIKKLYSTKELLSITRNTYSSQPSEYGGPALSILVELAKAGDEDALKGLVNLTSKGESYYATKSKIVNKFASHGGDIAKQAIIEILGKVPEDEFTVIEDVVNSLIRVGGEDVTDAIVKHIEKICADNTGRPGRIKPLIRYLKDKEGAHVVKALRYIHKRNFSHGIDKVVLDALEYRGVKI